MLHEVLLALSGHPSPLFDQTTADSFPLATPAESALLASVGRLGTLHRALKSHLARISAHHPSLICRAVATSVTSVQLSKFQEAILDAEEEILTKKSSVVGAYDIVPLAGIVSKFEPWKRRLDWFWDLACFMYPADAEPLSASVPNPPNPVCSGPAVLNRLRSDAHTGYPDIEHAALALLTVAERAWIRQLSVWLLNGTTTRNDIHDFFVHRVDNASSSAPTFFVSGDLIPSFVSRDTANSILFIGKTIGMLASSSPNGTTNMDSLNSSTSNLSLQAGERIQINTSHLKDLANLQSPIIPSAFSSLITVLRSSLAVKVVDELLTIHLFMRTLFLLRRFLLVGRGDFTDALIVEADSHISFRHQQTQIDSQGYSSRDLAGVMMKEGEVSAVLAKTWSALAPSIGKEEVVDEETEWAREHLFLALAKQPEVDLADAEKPNIAPVRTLLPPKSIRVFEDLLLSIPTRLSLSLGSAFDLFLGPDELQIYSSIHSYLLGIRRAHNHLTDAWRRTPLRRDHPAPIRRGRAKRAFQVLRDARRKRTERMNSMRIVWCCSNATVVALAELGEYLAGEVVEQSWNTFNAWAFQHGKNVTSFNQHGKRQASSTDSLGQQSNQLPRDPEILAQGHRQYLAALLEGLLLNDKAYPKILKSLFAHVDQLVAFIKRLENVQRDMDLRDEGVMINSKRNYEQEEQGIHDQLAKSCKTVNDDLARLKSCLQAISSKPSSWVNFKHSPTGFEPYSSRTGIDRLLMKLDFGASHQGND